MSARLTSSSHASSEEIMIRGQKKEKPPGLDLRDSRTTSTNDQTLKVSPYSDILTFATCLVLQLLPNPSPKI